MNVSLSETPPARVIRGRFPKAAHVPGPQPGCSRGLAEFLVETRRRPWDSLLPFAVLTPRRRVTIDFANLSTVAPTCRFADRATRRECSLARRDGLRRAGGRRDRPRLLGFGPAAQPCLASRPVPLELLRTGRGRIRGLDCLGLFLSPLPARHRPGDASPGRRTGLGLSVAPSVRRPRRRHRRRGLAFWVCFKDAVGRHRPAGAPT